MKTEEFWEKYTNNDILEIFDDACEFFSKELPVDFMEEYDVEEVLLEVRGQQEREKNFDKVLKFTNIIKNKQPALYQEVFQYYDDFLIDYYCFNQDSKQVIEAFANFIENPLQDFDSYLTQLNRVLFYQHTEILEKAVENNYLTASNSDDLIGGAEFDLAFVKMYTSMQAMFESKGKESEIPAFISQMKEFDFEFKDNFSKSIEIGLFKPVLNSDKIKAIFKENKESAFVIIRSYFLRYMFSKEIPFYVSAKITDRLPSYWYETNSSANSTDAFFRVTTESFNEFLVGFAGDMFQSNESEIIAVLWGSVHFYEFLYKEEFISQEVFIDFMETSKVMKGRVIARYLADLWKSDFIHTWSKPDCISDDEFAQEQNIFRKSFDLKHKPFNELKPKISIELSKIGELAYHIDEGDNYNPKPNMSLLDSIFDPNYKEPQYLNEDSGSPYIREEKKVGRNAPCSCGSGKKYKKCCG